MTSKNDNSLEAQQTKRAKKRENSRKWRQNNKDKIKEANKKYNDKRRPSSYYVYFITDVVTQEIIYIGCCREAVELRIAQHSAKAKTQNSLFYSYLREHGVIDSATFNDKFKLSVIVSDLQTKEGAHEAEYHAVQLFKHNHPLKNSYKLSCIEDKLKAKIVKMKSNKKKNKTSLKAQIKETTGEISC